MSLPSTCIIMALSSIQPHAQVKAMYDACIINGILLKLLIFNHIDHVFHYFRKIWPLHADDMNSILKLNYYLSFETGFSRFAMAKVVRILIACRALCTLSIMHYELCMLSAVHASVVEFGRTPCTPLAASLKPRAAARASAGPQPTSHRIAGRALT